MFSTRQLQKGREAASLTDGSQMWMREKKITATLIFQIQHGTFFSSLPLIVIPFCIVTKVKAYRIQIQFFFFFAVNHQKVFYFFAFGKDTVFLFRWR